MKSCENLVSHWHKLSDPGEINTCKIYTVSVLNFPVCRLACHTQGTLDSVFLGLLKSRSVPMESPRVHGLHLFHIFNASNSVWSTVGAGEIAVE